VIDRRLLAPLTALAILLIAAPAQASAPHRPVSRMKVTELAGKS
jgi:hypothetical protein